MNGNPLYQIIASLGLLVDPDAMLFELRPNKLHWQFTLVRMEKSRRAGVEIWPGPYRGARSLASEFSMSFCL